MNRLYFGDNLAWRRNTKEFPDASVDLVYIAVRLRGDSTAPRYVAGDIRNILVKGAIPGPNGGLVMIRSAVKAPVGKGA